jgi:nucleoside-diphosphate-sugar epimerase
VALVLLRYFTLFYGYPTNQSIPRSSDSDGDGPSGAHTLARTVAVIGGAGYIGSYLSTHLQSQGFSVTIFDMSPKFSKEDLRVTAIRKVHSTNLLKSDLSKFQAVIFLGGCTGRKACSEMAVHQVEDENVWSVIDIMKKLSCGQHLIAPSTSAVSEGTLMANETSPVKTDLLDMYSLSMWKREIRLKEYADQDDDCKLPRISLL